MQAGQQVEKGEWPTLLQRNCPDAFNCCQASELARQESEGEHAGDDEAGLDAPRIATLRGRRASTGTRRC